MSIDGLAGALLERDDSVAMLNALLARVRSKGRLVLVEGEAGVGKTALLRRFCDRPLRAPDSGSGG